MTVIPESQTEGKAPQAATQILDKLDTELALDAGDTGAAILKSDVDKVMLQVTQSAYDAIGTKDANTLYLIIG